MLSEVINMSAKIKCALDLRSNYLKRAWLRSQGRGLKDLRFCTIVRYFGECFVAVVISNRQVYGVSSDFPWYSMKQNNLRTLLRCCGFYFAVVTKTRNIKNIET